MSSKNHSPNSVLSKALFFSVVGLRPRMYWHRIAAAGIYPHREGKGFPMHAWRFLFDSTLFESCEPYSWYSMVGCEDSQHRLSKFSSFSLNDEPQSKIHDLSESKKKKKRSAFCNDGTFILATLHWWQPSTATLNDCPNLNFLPSSLLYRFFLEVRVQLSHLGLIISTLEIVLANILWDVLEPMFMADVHQCNKVDFPSFFMCLLYALLSFLFHCRLCIWNQHCLGWKIFYLCFSVSRSMRLWETDLQNLLNRT